MLKSGKLPIAFKEGIKKEVNMTNNVYDLCRYKELIYNNNSSWLSTLFPNNVFLENKVVPNTDVSMTANYFCKELGLIVEFLDPSHFTTSTIQIKDFVKKQTYENLGYKVVQIPYFIQLSSETAKEFFGFEEPNQVQQFVAHGFYDKNLPLPCDFNSIGVEKLYEYLERDTEYSKQVVDSLIDRIFEKTEGGWHYKDASYMVLDMAGRDLFIEKYGEQIERELDKCD